MEETSNTYNRSCIVKTHDDKLYRRITVALKKNKQNYLEADGNSKCQEDSRITEKDSVSEKNRSDYYGDNKSNKYENIVKTRGGRLVKKSVKLDL